MGRTGELLDSGDSHPQRHRLGLGRWLRLRDGRLLMLTKGPTAVAALLLHGR